jgi:hypothetical protein
MFIRLTVNCDNELTASVSRAGGTFVPLGSLSDWRQTFTSTIDVDCSTRVRLSCRNAGGPVGLAVSVTLAGRHWAGVELWMGSSFCLRLVFFWSSRFPFLGGVSPG